MENVKLKVQIPLFVILLYISFFCQSAVVIAAECKKCHQKIYDEIDKYPYQHSNIVQRECVGCHIKSDSESEKKGGGNAASEDEKHGRGGLKGWREIGIDVCIKCHKQGASHPVGVKGRGRIKIVNELPTGEGGVVTCVTCHTPHGGKKRYLGRLDFNKGICLLCHTDRV